MEEEKTCIDSIEQCMRASENSCIAGSEEEELIWAQKAITGYKKENLAEDSKQE